MKLAVIKTGGKQYLVKKNDQLYIEKINSDKGKQVMLDTLAIFDTDSKKVEIGKPLVKEKIKVEIVDQLKGDKIRVARFKAKSRYRRVKGHRQHLTKIKVLPF